MRRSLHETIQEKACVLLDNWVAEIYELGGGDKDYAQRGKDGRTDGVGGRIGGV